MIRVGIVDDQTLVRHGVRSLLELSPEVSVIGEAADGDEALAMLASDTPDVLLLDLRMPGKDGIDTLNAMRAAGIATPTLVLTTFDDDELVLRALRAGAKGYLLKDVTLEQLIDAIRVLAAGGSLVQPALTDRLLKATDQLPTPDDFDDLPPPLPLTDREQEILRLLAGGFANREIATALHLAEGTVKNHVSSLLTKLGVRDRTRAVLRALQHGLLTDSTEQRR
ncbi:DNA-binding response regulator [Prauserella marina]|uniref:DNA-binding response regulator, NarL/FixJ family, contains REC and HTH domains n=1 Tax=Prauserella marina TaxID=530584 RepID=A0A222VQL3_9PSEU|nr:response regulator transcription factor [Prauserella marina]ASR36142.1 DNA-binding response regulator [Prauserella marina]PWV76884.1 LuxR family two component transcriptional regulator [Prauserella marina]SDC99675.1 DNA-binding response regulator, NarL/FixJ family, contains REC and HTH domains [Prauserella marina]